MKRKKSPRLARRVGLPLYLSLSVSTGALAQTAAGGVVEGHVEDVVVSDQGAPDNAATANSVEAVSKKQETVLQDTPQAATVITQQQIEALQITNLQEAQKLEPSLQFRYGNVRNLTFNIRGFGAASSNATDAIFGGVPIYIDGVYQPRPGQAFFDIPDLNGMQVFKGPQGTSGGQDSTGGVVNITTSLPSFVAQETAEVSYGNYNYVQVKATATGANSRQRLGGLPALCLRHGPGRLYRQCQSRRSRPEIQRLARQGRPRAGFADTKQRSFSPPHFRFFAS